MRSHAQLHRAHPVEDSPFAESPTGDRRIAPVSGGSNRRHRFDGDLPRLEIAPRPLTVIRETRLARRKTRPRRPSNAETPKTTEQM